MIKYRSGSGIERYRPVNDIGRFWEEIARALNVYEVHIANAKGKNDMVAAAYEVVRLWLSYDVDASWEKLIDAMAVQEELNPAIENLKTALRNMAITGSTGEKSIASNGSNTQSILRKNNIRRKCIYTYNISPPPPPPPPPRKAARYQANWYDQVQEWL